MKDMKPTAAKGKEKLRTTSARGKGKTTETPKGDKKVKGDVRTTAQEKKDAPPQEESAEENICDQQTPELLRLSDITEISPEEANIIGISQKSNINLKPSMEKVKVAKTKAKVTEKRVDESKASAEGPVKKVKPKRVKESNIPRPTSAERKKEKQQVAERKVEVQENVVDTSDRLKEWLSNLNTESSKDSLAVHNNGSNPYESSGSTVTKPSLGSSVVPPPRKPLPVKEAETQTNVDLEAKRKKQLIMEENARLRHEQFLQRYQLLVDLQYMQAAKIWCISKELQNISLYDIKSQSELFSQASNGFDDNRDGVLEALLGDLGCLNSQTADDLRNVGFDGLSWPETRPNPKSLSWLEHELIHCEALERDSRDVAHHVLNHAPCLYGNGFLQRREYKPAATRVAFVDDWSVDGRISFPKGKSLKKRLQIFRSSIKVRKESPKRRGKKSRMLKNATPRGFNSGQYYLLLLLIIIQFCIQLGNM